MATQYSNKPIVTDGLVYALDFGNPKSYVSGSATANSLLYNPTPATFSTVPAGDYSNLAAAYSVRKVVSNYTGSAMQIRSASATLDIGFDANGNLNTASIAAFAGSGDAFVRTWYDQSGNARNAIQTDNADQPKVYSGSQGSVVLENGRPAIHFNEKSINTAGFLNSDIANRGISVFSVYSTVNYSGGLYNVDFIYSTSGGGLSRLIEFGVTGPTNTPQQFYSGIQFGQPPITVPFTYGQKIFSQIGGNSSSSLFINSNTSSSVSPITFPPQSDPSLPIYIGSMAGGNRGNFRLQEFILYNTQQFTNRTYIENNINSYYSAFNPTTDATPSPTNGFLNFTSPDSTVTNQSFPGFSYDRGNSTIMYVGETKGNSSVFTQDTNMSVVSTTSSVGFGSTSNNIGRTYPVTGLKHVTLRFSSGSVDCFVNGIPVPANSVFPTGSSVAGGRFAIPVYTGSLGLVQVYNRPLTGDEIWNNYQLTAPRYGLGALQNKPYTLDDNAYLFLSQSGITDPIITGSIDTFVRGLKQNNLWDKMIAIYPFVGTGSAGTNLTGSHRWNLKEPSLVTYPLSFTGSWIGSTSGSVPSGSNTNISTQVSPSTYYPFFNTQSAHISILSYDTPVSSSYLMGTGMTEDLAISTLAGDYGTPAAAYSVRKVRTAYTGALMDVRRNYDNVTQSIGFVSNGDLDTGSLLDWTIPGRTILPGAYSGLAAAYSLRRVSASYSGSAIDVRRIWDNTTSSIGFDSNGNLNTGSLLNFTTSGSNILPYSNDFSSNAKYGTQLTSSAILGPYGLGSGSFINEISTTGFHGFDYNINPVNTSSIHTVSCFVKKQERRYVGLGFAYNSGNDSYITFDLNTTASVASSSIGPGYSIISSSINYVTDGWFRISLTGTTGISDFYPRFYINTTPTAGPNTYLGEPGTGSYIYGFQYTTGSTVQPYIETTGTARYNVGNTSSFGYVTQWYDQSGNNRHATQTATGSQPLIVSSGSLVTENGKPALRFLIANSSSLNLPGSPLSGSNAFGLYAVANFLSVNPFEMLYAEGTTGNPVEIRRNNVFNTLQWITGDSTFPLGTASIDNRQILVTINRNPLVSNTAFVNGVLDATLTTGSDSIASTTASIGKRSDGYYFDGTVQEMSFFTGSAASSSRPLIENNINNYYNIYTGSNHGFVSRWYDQSGNNRHATQTATGSQPMIVLSGSIITENTRSALSFDGTSMFFDLSSNITATSPFSSFAVGRRSSNGTAMLFYGGSGVTHGLSVDDKYYLQKSTGYLQSNNTDTTNQQILLSGIATTTTQSQFKNSSEIASTFTAAGIVTTISKLGYYVPATPYYFNGKYQELSLYLTDQTNNREPIEYNINNYYNIYPQTSSFATSSFTIQATPTAISGAINNRLTSGIPSSGPLGLITVSRTGSNSLTIARNGVTSSFAVPASGALSTGIFLGAINNNGLALGNSPLNLSFASVGTGLTGADVINLSILVSNFKLKFIYPEIVTDGLVSYLDAGNIRSYPTSGSTWNDLTYAGVSGTLTGSAGIPSYSALNGGSIVFDGSDKWVNQPYISSLDLSLQGTLSIWCYLNSVNQETYAGLIGMTTGGSAGQQSYYMNFLSSNSTLSGNIGNNGVYNSISIPVPNSIGWYNFVFTWNGTVLKFYENNIQKTPPVAQTINAQSLKSDIRIGGRMFYPAAAGLGEFNGRIAISQIYNRALTDAEVLQNFNATRGRFGI